MKVFFRGFAITDQNFAASDLEWTRDPEIDGDMEVFNQSGSLKATIDLLEAGSAVLQRWRLHAKARA